MAALLLIRLAGSVVSACNSSCYDAASPARLCECVCGGTNHGVGLEAAIANTRDLYRTWLEQARQRGVAFTSYVLDEQFVQDPLFSLEDL